MAKTKKSLGQRVAAVVAVLLVLAVVGLGSAWATGWAVTGEANPAKWNNFKPTGVKPTNVAVSSDGQLMENGGTYAMPAGFTFLSARSTSSATTEYVAGGEITLTASLSNEYINGKFDWSADFKDPNAEWAQGKVAGYYVALEPSEDGRKVTVKYLAKFSEQIILTATLQGSDSSDSCTIDCLKSVTVQAPAFYGTDFTDGLTFEAKFVFGEGTVEGDFEFQHAKLAMDSDFIREFQNYLTFNVNVTPYNVYQTDCVFKATVFKISNGLGVGFEPTSILELSFSMFIDGFEDYDQAHKEAIYYAWFQAYNERNDSSNALLDFDFNYLCQGVIVDRFSDTDVIGGRITGDCYGADVEPSVTLNKNVIF